MTPVIVFLIISALAYSLGKWSDYDMKKREARAKKHPRPGNKPEIDRLLDLDVTERFYHN